MSFELDVATWRQQYQKEPSFMLGDAELHLPVQAIAAKLAQQGILGRLKVVLSSTFP